MTTVYTSFASDAQTATPQRQSIHHQPIIGVTTKFGDADWVTNHTSKYIDVLVEFGAIGVALSPDAPAVFPDGTSYTPDAAGRLPGMPCWITWMASFWRAVVTWTHRSLVPRWTAQIPKSISRPRDELELGLTKAALTTDHSHLWHLPRLPGTQRRGWRYHDPAL